MNDEIDPDGKTHFFISENDVEDLKNTSSGGIEKNINASTQRYSEL